MITAIVATCSASAMKLQVVCVVIATCLVALSQATTKDDCKNHKGTSAAPHTCTLVTPGYLWKPTTHAHTTE